MRLLYLSFLSLPLIGCYGGERYNTGECPAGETCSDLTPSGLQFIGNSPMGTISVPHATAVGGTQAIALQYERYDGVDIALDLPFTADDDGGRGIKVDAISGSQVIIRGVDSRSNYLRILDSDGLLMDRKELTGAKLEGMFLVADDFESIPDDAQLAFAAGKRQLGVGLYGAVQTSSGPRSQRLIDTSMDLQLAGATRKAWDILEADLVVGTSTLVVTAGDKPAANLDVVVVDHADSVAAIQPAPTNVAINSSATVCFQALAAGRYIAGLTWTYRIDNGSPIVQGDGKIMRNCISVPSGTKTSGTITVQATAGGQMASLALTVGGMARELGITAEPKLRAPLITTAGDRAEMSLR
jgi:hypothetical protein